jgi:hypothetical protein
MEINDLDDDLNLNLSQSDEDYPQKVYRLARTQPNSEINNPTETTPTATGSLTSYDHSRPYNLRNQTKTQAALRNEDSRQAHRRWSSFDPVNFLHCLTDNLL